MDGADVLGGLVALLPQGEGGVLPLGVHAVGEQLAADRYGDGTVGGEVACGLVVGRGVFKGARQRIAAELRHKRAVFLGHGKTFRQGDGAARLGLKKVRLGNAVAVSYTHLDVYKRQDHGWSATGLPGLRKQTPAVILAGEGRGGTAALSAHG